MFWRPVLPSLLAATMVATIGLAPTHEANAVTASPSGYSLDPSFSSDGVVQLAPWTSTTTVTPFPDGSALVGLERRAPVGTLLGTGLVKIAPTGSVDTTFGVAGVLDLGTSTRMVTARDDGRFLVGTRQYLANGQVDATFGFDGYATFSPGGMGSFAEVSIFETSEHHLLIAGNSLNGCYIWRVATDGIVEPAVLGKVLGPTNCVNARSVRRPDGTSVLVFHQISIGDTAFVFAADGSLVTSPDNPTGAHAMGGVLSSLVDAAATSDGALLLMYDSGGGSSGRSVARVLPDWSYDTNFGSGGFIYAPLEAADLVVDPADSIILVGRAYFPTHYPFTPFRSALVRLTPRGDIDRNFNIQGAVPGWVDVSEFGFDASAVGGPLAIDADGRLLIAFDQRPTDPTQRTTTVLRLSPTFGLPALRRVATAATANAFARRLRIPGP